MSDLYVDAGYWFDGYTLEDAPPDVPVQPSGPQRLLYELMPLRTSRQLGDYAVDAPLAHVFGDLTAARFPLVRLTPTRGHAADHPMEITGAGTGTTPTSSYAAVVEADATGKVCTFVDFGAPVDAADQMWAYGRGVRNPLTGALMTNPADILEYISALCGRSDKFQQLREECAAAGIRLAGRVADNTISIRATNDLWTQPAGAIWSPGMARRFPSLPSGYVIDLDDQVSENITVDEVSDDTADVLRISYDQCDVTGKPQKSIELTANPQRFGGIALELSLPNLRTPANAEAVGVPILQRQAGRRYTVGMDTARFEIRPGQWIKLRSHPEWPTPDIDPPVMILSVNPDRDSETSPISGEFQASYPEITVTAHSILLADTFNGSLEVSERNGIATFTVFDENHKGLQGARISLDGGAPKTTDASGQAPFPYISGHTYRIDVEAAGRQSQEVEWTL